MTKFSDIYTNHSEKTYVNYRIMAHVCKVRLISVVKTVKDTDNYPRY